jgi:hypothetical protein
MIDEPAVRILLLGIGLLLSFIGWWSFREQFARTGTVGALLDRWRDRKGRPEEFDQIGL